LSSSIKPSKLRSELALMVDLPLLMDMQQISLVRIVYDPTCDKEPLIKTTEKGKQIIDIVQALQDTTQLIFR
jgi:hypothetical protein